MKNIHLLTAVATLGLAGSLQAGTSYDKNPAPKAPPIDVPALCDCFDAGKVQVSLYGAGIVFSNDSAQDDALGGGLSFGYFFSEYAGIEADATWLATDSVMHHFTGSLVLRYPIKSACIAPYVLVGGGYETDSVQQGTWHVGGGVDIRLGHSGNCPGIFADARYTWTEDEEEFTVIRAGLRFNL